MRGRKYSTAVLAGDIVIAPAQSHSSLSAQRPVPAREMNEQTNNPGQTSSQNPFAPISAPSVQYQRPIDPEPTVSILSQLGSLGQVISTITPCVL